MTTPVDRRSTRTTDRDVTASEVAAYAYCAKAWHLERVLGATASSDANRRRAAGVGDHARHGARVATLRAAGRTLAFGAAALLALALLLLLAALTLALGR